MDPTLSAADQQANIRKERLRSLSRSRLSRRSFLQAAGVAGVGAAGVALVGCGDYIEVWNPGRWSEELQTVTRDASEEPE